MNIKHLISATLILAGVCALTCRREPIRPQSPKAATKATKPRNRGLLRLLDHYRLDGRPHRRGQTEGLVHCQRHDTRQADARESGLGSWRTPPTAGMSM